MITNGIWFIDAVEINGGSTNFMNGFLPEYKEDTSLQGNDVGKWIS